MQEPTPNTPLASLPDLAAGQAASVERCLRVFGPKSAAQYAKHLSRLKTGKPWFVLIDSRGAKCFTHFVKLEKAVKNPRSMTGNQKFIARSDSWGMIF